MFVRLKIALRGISIPLVLGIQVPHVASAHVSNAPAEASVSVAPESPAGEDIEVARKRAGAELVAALNEHADWCQANKVYLQRDISYEKILLFDPEHKAARKFLGWTFDKKAGEWVRLRPYKEPRDAKAEVVLEAIEKRKAAMKGYKERLLAALDGDEKISPKKYQEVLAELIALLPDDDDLRQRNGQVKVEGEEGARWVTEESKRGLEWRGLLRERKQKMFADSPAPRESFIEEDEKATGIAWKGPIENDRVRVLTTGGENEARRVAQVCYVVWDFTRDLFEHELDPSYTVYLLSDSKARDAMINSFADSTPEEKDRLRQTGGMGRGSKVYNWAPSEDARVDSSCRQSLAILMARRFGINSRHGWAHEGFGMYITERLLGTRLTFFVRATDYTEGNDKNRGGARMMDPDSDWLRMARRALEGEKKPNIGYALGRDVNALTGEDLLVSYALAAFLLEGHPPEKTVAILTRIGSGDNPIEVMEQELGYDLGTLATRLHDWLVDVGK